MLWGKDARKRLGGTWRCFPKSRKFGRAHYEANRDRVLEKHRAFREKNREAISAQGRAYYKENRERIRAYREANREAISKRNRAYREANREAISEQQRAYYEANREQLLQRDRDRYDAIPTLDRIKMHIETNARKRAQTIARRKEAFYGSLQTEGLD